MVEHRTVNALVVGSSPTLSAIEKSKIKLKFFPL